VWIGGVIMAIGGLIVMWPTAERRAVVPPGPRTPAHAEPLPTPA
jgi:hypothetical protein